MKNKLFITSIIIAVVSLGISVATAYFMFNNDLPRVVGFDNIPALDMIVATTTNDAVEWKIYENTKYGYNFFYPSNASIQKVSEMESGGVDESEYIKTFIPGADDLFGVYIWNKYTDAPDELLKEHNDIILLSLEDFANNLYKTQIDHYKAYSNKTISGIRESVLSENKTFEFSTDKGFVYGNLTGGYSLNNVNRYIITENNNGDKIIIHYPVDNSLSEEIIKTFKFSE